MMDVVLKKSAVVFDSESHTYTLAGKKLSGITALLDRQLFKDKYADIPEDILRRAAERGTLVHQCCEMADEGFPVTSQEGLNYLALKEKHNLKWEESEYLVSDNEHYASCIDKVYRYDHDTFFLGDIKTTYKLNKEYVMWQLSIYAYLFEKQNPGARVASVFAIWLRGDMAQLVILDRVPDEKVERLLYCDSHGMQYEEQQGTMPAVFKDMESIIISTEAELKVLTEKKKILMDGLMREMVKAGIYQWKGDSVTLTRKTASVRKTFDKKRFEKDYPGVYENYLKETLQGESLYIKIK